MTHHTEQLPFAFSYQMEVDWWGRRLPFHPDYSKLPACECSAAFLQHVRERYPNILDYPTIRSLDEAILAITLDYAHRLQALSEHPLNYCLPEVFNDILSIIYTKRDELLRRPNPANTAHLYIGKEEEAPVQDETPTPPPPPSFSHPFLSR